jgi:hypothetical protein
VQNSVESRSEKLLFTLTVWYSEAIALFLQYTGGVRTTWLRRPWVEDDAQ